MKPKCLFCDSDKEGGRVEAGKDFICGSCVQRFITLDGDQLGSLYLQACACKQTRKAEALSSFIHGRSGEHRKKVVENNA